MSALFKVLNTWKKETIPYVKINDEWKIPKSAWTKVSDSWKSWFLQGGVYDSGFKEFDNSSGFSGGSLLANLDVSSIIVQPDEKILVAGSFNFIEDKICQGVARLNSDGTPDLDFINNLPTGFGPISLSGVIERQSDGKILVGRPNFQTSPGSIARLNANGSHDTSFVADSQLSSFSGNVRKIKVQEDGKILFAGSFSNLSNIIRLNSDGSLDQNFLNNVGTGGNSDIFTVDVQEDGKILLGGEFTQFNGISANRFIRLNEDGTIDQNFLNNIGSGFNSGVRAIAVQDNQKILVTGFFSTFNVSNLPRLVRLENDGSLDTSFTGNPNFPDLTSTSGYDIAIQEDGKIVVTTSSGSLFGGVARINEDGSLDQDFFNNVSNGISNTLTDRRSGNPRVAIGPTGNIFIGGIFLVYNNKPARRFLKLNPDGTRDLSFFQKTGFDSRIFSVTPQRDKKILVGGDFVSFNDQIVSRMARLNEDGSLDQNFQNNLGSGFSSTINKILIQDDNKILVAGDFSSLNGTSTRTRIVRLNQDGTRDLDFTENISLNPSGSFFDIALQSDGKILIGADGASWNNIVRLNPDGTTDLVFENNKGTGASSFVKAVEVLNNGKILVAGNFTSFNGTAVNRVILLNNDGTIDEGFLLNIGSGVNAEINSAAIQPDGKILLVGRFTSFNGSAANRVVRLNGDGTRDNSFQNLFTVGGLSVLKVIVHSSGKIVLGGDFSSGNPSAGTFVTGIFRLNSDGTIDQAFRSNVRPAASDRVFDLAETSDGKILVAGQFGLFSSKISNNLAKIGGDIAT